MDSLAPYNKHYKLIKGFNNDSSIPKFLLATKAGGLGLNLCTAGRRIIYDREWIPSTGQGVHVEKWAETERRDRGMSTPQELIQLLTSLKTVKFIPRSEFRKTICLVDKILETFFKIEVAKTELSAKERNIIGPLIADSLNVIGAWVSCSVDQIDEAHIENYKIKRSGLEFVFEKYQELPDGKGNFLGVALQNFKLAEDIEGWDQQFKSVNSSFDPNVFYKTSDEPTLTDQEKKQVPASHWWWSS